MNLLNNITDNNVKSVIDALKNISAQKNQPIFIIGGYVRDLLLERPTKDIDIVTEGSGVELANETAAKLNVKKINIFKNFGTAMFNYNGLEVEFVGARKESYRSESRKPIVEDGSLQDDQNRRDFTINALAINLHPNHFGELVDPFNGMEDLKNKIIRTPLNPDITYSDDPLRMMRGIRFATQLGFTIEENSFKSITKNAERISIISKERITDELNKIILAKKPSIGFKMLFDTGLLPLIFPEITALQGVEEQNGKGHKDNFYHTLEVLDNVAEKSENLWLRWAAILHDIAKPVTKKFDEKHGWTFHGHEDKGARMVPKIFRNLRLPADHKMKYVQKLVALHLRPIALTKEEITDSALRRLIFDADEDLEDLMLLCRCDITSKNKEKVKKYLLRFDMVEQKLKDVEERDHIKNWQPPISGEEIITIFDLKPSKEVGILKNSIKDAILEGEIANNYQEAFNFMLLKAKELGLTPKKK
ncbi:MAG: CCA tRNA nucleotidyltransferase [Bacteroidia bacterium]